MRVRLDIGLDQDGIHTFRWDESESPSAVDVPRSTLDRWTAEREAFQVAYLRWKRVCEDVEDALYRATSARTEPEVALTAAVKASKARNRR